MELGEVTILQYVNLFFLAFLHEVPGSCSCGYQGRLSLLSELRGSLGRKSFWVKKHKHEGENL